MDVVAPPPPPRPGPPPSALGVAFLGLLLPGLGHVLAGRPGKGFFYFCLVGLAFTAGLWMTGLVAVQPERDPLWFAGQLLAGVPTLAVWKATEGLVATERLPAFDLGMLYTAVAGLLNVIAIADALGLVDDQRAVAEMRRRADAADAAARAATEPADASPPTADGPRLDGVPAEGLPSGGLPSGGLPAEEPASEGPEIAGPDRGASDAVSAATGASADARPAGGAPEADRATDERGRGRPDVGGPLP